MNDFMERNRKLVLGYCRATQIVGWLVLVISVPWIVVALVSAGGDRVDGRALRWELQHRSVDILVGLVALGVSQFIRCLLDKDHRAGWALRSLPLVLYLFAAVLVTKAVFVPLFLVRQAAGFGFSLDQWLIAVMGGTTPSLGVLAAKILILVGLAHVARGAMGMLEEHRTPV